MAWCPMRSLDSASYYRARKLQQHGRVLVGRGRAVSRCLAGVRARSSAVEAEEIHLTQGSVRPAVHVSFARPGVVFFDSQKIRRWD